MSPRLFSSLFAAHPTDPDRSPFAARAARAASAARLTCSTCLSRISGQARDAFGRLSTPSKVTFGAAAATAVAVTGVVVGVSSSATPALGTASRQAAMSDDAGAAGQHPAARSASPAGHAATRPAAPAHRTAAHRTQAHRATPAGHHAAAGHRTASHRAASHRAAGHRAAAGHAARHRAAAKPYLIYDSVTPGSIPGHHVIATYATGSYAVSRAQVADRKHVLWIDTTGLDHGASVLDVEPGDATPGLAASWAWHRLHADPHVLARIYTMRSEWPAVQAAVSRLPARMRSHIRWWIADPTGVPHVVPGSQATQWYWGSNYDITTATPGF